MIKFVLRNIQYSIEIWSKRTQCIIDVIRLDLINSSFRVSIRIASGNLVVDMLLVFTRNQNELFRSDLVGILQSPVMSRFLYAIKSLSRIHFHIYIFHLNQAEWLIYFYKCHQAKYNDITACYIKRFFVES